MPIQPFELLSDADLEDLPPPEWLIEGTVPMNALVVVYGEPGSGKTFLALDWAYSIATGRDWCGFAVNEGPVIYVAAEGVSGLRNRAQAWKKVNKVKEKVNVYILPEPVQFRERGEISRLLHTLNEFQLHPRTIMVDTLARCMSGGDENSASDMGRFVTGIDKLRRETEATVIVLHHLGKNQAKKERGSTALRGAADTMIKTALKQRKLTITCDKQKDGEPFTIIEQKLVIITLVDGQTSCVLYEIEPHEVPLVLQERDRTALQMLGQFGERGATSSEWRDALKGAGSSEATFHRARRELEEGGFISNPNPGAKGTRYTLTDKGQEAVNVT